MDLVYPENFDWTYIQVTLRYFYLNKSMKINISPRLIIVVRLTKCAMQS